MERVFTEALPRHVGERVRIAGWLHAKRELSRVSFLVLRDATGLAQAVLDAPERRRQLSEFPSETVLEVEGEVAATPQAPRGIELHDCRIHVLAVAEPPPVDLRRPVLREQLATILDYAPVALRHPCERAKFQLAAASIAGFRAALAALRFTEIQTPKLVSAATEGGASVFAVDYFGRTAYLAQSPQFYKQTMVGVFERVFETGPVFRAEPHDTARHLAEYVSLDAELGFIKDHRAVMTVARDAVAGMVRRVRSHAREAVELLELRLPDVPAEIPSIDFVQAQELLEAETGERVVGEPDLSPAHERWLGEWARREHNSDFVFVVGYPMAKRPFYTHPDPRRPGFSNSFDLLFRGLEVTTGGQRLHRHADYIAALAERGLDPAPFAGYLQAFRYGMPPHGGFALGLERWVSRLVGARNVRETTLFPRDRARVSP
jgi:nondiscriminating aspartyl-tRNA synthetase